MLRQMAQRTAPGWSGLVFVFPETCACASLPDSCCLCPSALFAHAHAHVYAYEYEYVGVYEYVYEYVVDRACA